MIKSTEYLLTAIVGLVILAAGVLCAVDAQHDKDLMDAYLADHHCVLRDLRPGMRMYKCDDDLSVWVRR